MRAEIKISVALVTRNRPESLDRCLKSLRKQSVQPFEVIVSDDSDSNLALATELVARKWHCKYIRGLCQGLYVNRNHVVLTCSGTHVRTMDDDHEFPENHFEKCISSVQSDPSSVWIIGEYSPNQKVLDKPHPCPGQLHPRGFSVTPKDTQNCWAISDGASIYPIEMFKRGIKYTDSFKFGYAYLELGSRLHWLGYRVRHLDSTFVIHHFDVNNRSFMIKSVDLSSKFFAMLCHSFIYQTSVKNKFFSIMEICKKIIIHNFIGVYSLYKALKVFRVQTKHSMSKKMS